MKKILLLLLILLLVKTNLSAADTQTAPVDTALKEKEKLNTLTKEVGALKTTTGAIKDSVTSISKKLKACSCIPVKKGKAISGGEWVLIFLPVGVFLLVVILLFFALKDFDYKEALKENEVTKVTVPNPYYTGQLAAVGQSDYPLTMEVTPNITTVPVAGVVIAGAPAPTAAQSSPHNYTLPGDMYRSSISRYIALISSILIIITAVCISCFFIYHYINTGCPPELSALSAVILALGIGIVPYAANKISSAVAGNKSEV